MVDALDPFDKVIPQRRMQLRGCARGEVLAMETVKARHLGDATRRE